MILQFLIKNKDTNSDEDEIRTHAGNPNGLAVQRLNHSATSSWNFRYFHLYFF